MSKFLKSSIISAIGLAILGILLVFESELTIVSISYVIGAILVAIGTIAILNFVNDMKKNVKNELNIVYGIGMVVLGIIVISNPKGVASIIPFILGVLIIINSAAKLQYSLELKKDNNKLWNSTMIMALITLLCGILLVFNPFSGAEFITKVVGVLLFIYAVTDIISSLRIRKTVKNIQKVIENNTVKEAEVIEDKTKENKSEEE
jgi:uncharacterized membrane protein HdeD (DUF308 family)